VLPFGAVEPGALEAVERRAGSRFGLDVRRLEALPEPAFAWDPGRGQHDSTAILRRALEARRPDACRILAVTEVDLFIPMLTFVFGQALLGGDAALISLARLRQEFYGFPPAPHRLAERAVKEALHELGHTFGLVHCPDRTCAASLSTHVQQIDAKQPEFCRGCAALLRQSPAAAAAAGLYPVGSEELL
jgi:archaemetzincin